MRSVRVTFHHTEDDLTTITGPNRSMIIAHNGGDYSMMQWDSIKNEYVTLQEGSYNDLLTKAKSLVA